MDSFLTRDPAKLTSTQLEEARDRALEQFQWAREYTLQLVKSVPEELWYSRPEGCATHLAWQVGHLCVSQYGLMLFRQRGRDPIDLELMPGWLRKQFGRGTEAKDAGERSPNPEELLNRLSEIHRVSLETVQSLAAEVLAEPIDMPYCVYPCKLGAVLFAPVHESIHAGQIGLLRRLHGLDPLR